MATQQQPEPRGVIRYRDEWPGVSTFRVHTCRGVQLAKVEIPDAFVDQQVEDDHWAFLEKHCPTGHGAVCPADQLRLDRQIGTNRGLVQARHLRLESGSAGA